jgi:NAD(P)-dependent dehydrogenase (short-subunit alcohol dehydrogenase family)
MALELARRGASVAVNYANAKEAAEEVVKQIEGMKTGAKAIAVKANVANVKETQHLMDEVVKHFGKLDICCSNSGVVSFGHFKDVDEAEYDRVMQINTRGQFFVAKEAYKRMSVGGRIILMGSITGQAKGVPKHAVYSGSKGAIETFTRCMAIGMFHHDYRLRELSLTAPQMLVRRGSQSTASRPVASKPTCTTLCAESTFPKVQPSPTTKSTNTPLPGRRAAVLVSP